MESARRLKRLRLPLARAQMDYLQSVRFPPCSAPGVKGTTFSTLIFDGSILGDTDSVWTGLGSTVRFGSIFCTPCCIRIYAVFGSDSR